MSVFTVGNRLSEMRSLNDGWAGEGSLAPRRETIDNAFELMSLAPEDAEVTPETNGTVSLEWGGCHLEVGLTKFSMYTPGYFIDGTIKRRDQDCVLTAAER